eukprot:Tbor_TRINITY_DN5325_c3_g2::TRINITY_DN5325_c3_g2_i1::g.5024::m.5024
MGFQSTVITSFIFMFLDLTLTTARPTCVNCGLLADYILLGVHLFVVLLEGVVIFVLFSGTIWMPAGLLGQLFHTIRATFPLWILRFLLAPSPWLYFKFKGSLTTNKPWSDGVYCFISILDMTTSISFSIALCYTMCALTDKRMYFPYHNEVGREERDAVAAINHEGASVGRTEPATVNRGTHALQDNLFVPQFEDNRRQVRFQGECTTEMGTIGDRDSASTNSVR